MMLSEEQTASETESGEAESLVGRWLAGKWRVDRLIGTGGMSSVYAATHRNGRCVAVKVLSPALSASPRARARFQREGYLANRVGHPNAVSVLDDDVSDGVAFLIMDLLKGRTLEALRLARGGRLEPDEVAWIGLELLAVLEAAHQRGIYHRDVKPANLFLTEERQLKLLDFGIASLRQTPGVPSITETAAMLGTPGFMAPEQARGRVEAIGPSTDVWATGAVLFRLLSGRLVHEGGTASELKIAAATEDAPRLSSVAPGLPPALSSVVDRALRRSADERWPSAAAMREALAGAAERDCLTPRFPELAPARPSGVTPSAPRSPARTWRPLRIALLVTAPVALGALGFMATRSTPAPSATAAPSSPSLLAAGVSSPSAPATIVTEPAPPPAPSAATAVAHPRPAASVPPLRRRGASVPATASASPPPTASGSVRPAPGASARPAASSLPHDLLKQRL